jgi:hypothetical protein
MSVITLQAEVTKTSAPFNGSAVDISALATPFEIEVTVDTLLSGATAILELQTSTDNFSSDIRIEQAVSFYGTGTLGNYSMPVSRSYRDFDLPGFRAGTTSAKARISLVYLDAGASTLSAPGTVTPIPSGSGGTLAAATYFYKVTALGNSGETLPSPETSGVTTTGTTSSVALAWGTVTGATSYRIYRGTSSGAESVYYTSATNSFTDTGAAGTSGTPPTFNTTGSPTVSYSTFIKQ